MGVLPACISAHYGSAWYQQRTEKDVKSPGTRVTDSWKLLCGWLKLYFLMIITDVYVRVLTLVFILSYLFPSIF